MKRREALPMPSTPSIKGSAISKLVEDVAKLLEKEGLSQSQAARWLRPEDFELLEHGIAISSWYDIRSYTRLSELLLETEGHGDPEFLRERGRRAAQRLLEAGVYAQFEYLQRTQASKTTDTSARFAAFGRDLRILNTISASILNFTKWTSRPDPDHERRYLIEVSEAENVPDTLCWTTDGFVNQMATQHRPTKSDMWSWERVGPDLIVFYMNVDI